MEQLRFWTGAAEDRHLLIRLLFVRKHEVVREPNRIETSLLTGAGGERRISMIAVRARCVRAQLLSHQHVLLPPASRVWRCDASRPLLAPRIKPSLYSAEAHWTHVHIQAAKLPWLHRRMYSRCLSAAYCDHSVGWRSQRCARNCCCRSAGRPVPSLAATLARTFLSFRIPGITVARV